MINGSQEEYDHAMSGQAEAESEAQAMAAYHEYLNQLLAEGRHTLWAIEVALVMLNSSTFKKSGLSATEYLGREKRMLEEAAKPIVIVRENRKDINGDELPF